MILREIIDIVSGYSKFADTLHETLPQNISSIFAIPGKIMDLRTCLLFRILIPFLNELNDNISHFFYGSHNFLNLVFCNLINMHTSGTYHCSLACGTDLLGKFPAQILVFVSGQIQYGRRGTVTTIAGQVYPGNSGIAYPVWLF